MSRQRLKPDDRRAAILDAAIQLAALPGGWANLTRGSIARAANCSEALPSRYFGTMTNFRRDIMREAINRLEFKIIAQGIVSGDPTATKAPDEIKRSALSSIAQ